MYMQRDVGTQLPLVDEKKVEIEIRRASSDFAVLMYVLLVQIIRTHNKDSLIVAANDYLPVRKCHWTLD